MRGVFHPSYILRLFSSIFCKPLHKIALISRASLTLTLSINSPIRCFLLFKNSTPQFPPPSVAMEGAAQSKASFCNGATSSSFRLRSPSLNSVRLRRIFDVFDRNNDGMITVDELSEALNLLGLNTDFSEMESTVRTFIKPGYIGLRFEDFDALHRSLDDAFFGSPVDYDLNGEDAAESTSTSCTAQEEKDLTEAFKVFDEDGDGFISATELQGVLAKLGLQEEGREIDRVEQMISSVDQNHDGRVDFFEFKDMMRSVIVRTS